MTNVAVLLATYNGEAWIGEQLATIRKQHSVQVRVIASDDLSSDRTLQILREAEVHGDLQILLPAQRMGNANRNFLYLIANANIGDSDYVAFCDQDDLWFADKLNRAIGEIQRCGADAYSSDVLAFWPDGKTSTLRKAGPQKIFDHLFESPGPGCTFVFPVRQFLMLKDWIRRDYQHLQNAPVHDWLIYAYFREQGLRWIIDDAVGLRYRQHGGNETGANVGLKPAMRRLSLLRSGEFRRRVLWISEAVRHKSDLRDRLTTFSFGDRLWLAMNASNMRRSGRDALLLAASFLFAKKQPR